MTNAQNIFDTSNKKPLTGPLYAVLFLILTTVLYFWLSVRYDRHLIRAGQFGAVGKIHEHSELVESLFYAIQLLIVLPFFHPLGQLFAPRTEPESGRVA